MRPRLHNTLALIIGAAFSWAICAWIITQLESWLGWQVHGGWYWLTLFGLHTLFSSGLGLLPGWGLGIVRELQLMSYLTAFVLFSRGLTLTMIENSMTPLLSVTLTALILVPVLMGVRSFIKWSLLRRGKWGIPVVIYGAARTGQLLLGVLRRERGLGYRPIAFFDDDRTLQGGEIGGLPVVAPTERGKLAAPLAFVAMPGMERERLVRILDGPLGVYHSVIVIPNLFEMQSLWARSRDLGGILGLELTSRLADPLARANKRFLDLMATLLSLPFWGPLCLLIALLIWLEDRHSPLFLQKRVGLGGREFHTWKFRTMVPNAEQVLQQRLSEDPELRAEWEKNFKLKKDPRITRLGAFLRKTSLDEFPQLVNVLRGEMSLVGPRPLPAYHQQELPAEVQRLRLEVRPGMTGLWQVSGRSDVGNEGMVQLDPYYVRNWSIWLDIVIMLRTGRAVLRSAGAY